MISWQVKMSTHAEIEFKKMQLQRLFSKNDLAALRTWLNEMEEHGPIHIEKSKLWNDHPLYYEWVGFRASCFSQAGRIIYKILNYEVLIEIHRVTTDHNYKKKEN